MTKILFICHGNICRSAMAKYVMQDLVRAAGRQREFEIDSAATTNEEIGNPVYPPAWAERGGPLVHPGLQQYLRRRPGGLHGTVK